MQVISASNSQKGLALVLFFISAVWICVIYYPISKAEPNAKNHGFTVNYEKDTFEKDGVPFYYVSGSLHYFRVPRALWYDRLLKLRASGINVVSTYVAWNVHEPHPEHYKFGGDADLVHFIQTAQKVGLLVNLRPGPYICAEWDLGGLPYFVLGSPDDRVYLRTMDSRYIKYVDRYFSVLFKKIKPLLYENGGPIILVQIENEYGSYKACDHSYMRHLTNITRAHLGDKVVLYTADGWDMHHLICGPMSYGNVLTTINFGPNSSPDVAFGRLKFFQKHGPKVNSEYYPGWLDHWSEPHQKKEAGFVAEMFEKQMLSDIYVNFFMFMGGTNFGFYNGANNAKYSFKYQPDPTSYDYDAPMTECGDTTDKYRLIRDTIKKHHPELIDESLLSQVKNSEKSSYGKVMFTQEIPFNKLKTLSVFGHMNERIETFEELGLDFGFLMLESDVEKEQVSTLTIADPRDRVYVFLDGNYQNFIYRTGLPVNKSLELPPFKRMTLLIENMGRINYGDYLHDHKGIIGKVMLDEADISELPKGSKWSHWCLPLNNTNSADYSQITSPPGPASVLRGTVQVPDTPADTWLKLANFEKGVAFVNGHNLGRYWPNMGPQRHLYIPSVYLTAGSNTVTIFELEHVPEKMEDLWVELVDHPDVG